jgi:hypothetical protein
VALQCNLNDSPHFSPLATSDKKTEAMLPPFFI